MSGQRLYVTADWSRIVPEDSPEAAFFITEEDARARGLLTKAMPAPADKAVHGPPEDKGRATRVAQRSRR